MIFFYLQFSQKPQGGVQMSGNSISITRNIANPQVKYMQIFAGAVFSTNHFVFKGSKLQELKKSLTSSNVF